MTFVERIEIVKGEETKQVVLMGPVALVRETTEMITFTRLSGSSQETIDELKKSIGVITKSGGLLG